MQNWIDKLDAFLDLNDRDILKDAGKISHQLAQEQAEEEYEKYHEFFLAKQESDFDKLLKQIESGKDQNKS
jgi:hypothetical protein